MIKYILILMLFIAACQSKSTKNSLVESGESKSEKNTRTCSCDLLVLDSNGVFIFEDSPFTGNCIVNYKDTNIVYIEKQFLKGRLNGKVIYYDQSGRIIFEENYQHGDYKLNLKKENLHCNCKQLEVKQVNKSNKYYFDGALFTGRCSDLYPNSEQAYFMTTYKNGLLDGLTIYYDRSGGVLYTERYEANELTRLTYPE